MPPRVVRRLGVGFQEGNNFLPTRQQSATSRQSLILEIAKTSVSSQVRTADVQEFDSGSR